MSVNQSINPEVVVGVRVRVIDGGRNPDAFFELDSGYVGKEGVIQYVDRSYTVYQPDAAVQFDDGETAQIELQNLQVITDVAEAKASGEAGTKPTPRVNYLYVVEDEDGAYVKTFDRAYAREVKAELGGKKAGVIITAYAAVKEIR